MRPTQEDTPCAFVTLCWEVAPIGDILLPLVGNAKERSDWKRIQVVFWMLFRVALKWSNGRLPRLYASVEISPKLLLVLLRPFCTAPGQSLCDSAQTNGHGGDVLGSMAFVDFSNLNGLII